MLINALSSSNENIELFIFQTIQLKFFIHFQFSNEGKDLVIQFTVKHEQNIDCGGGYAKIFPCDFDGKAMHGETPYNIMFGKYTEFMLLHALKMDGKNNSYLLFTVN